MTYHDYKIYMAKRTRSIELKLKGKRVEIPAKIKPIKYSGKIGYLDILNVLTITI
jgi:hypothetical protein